MKDFIAGLHILSNYVDMGIETTCWMGAEHDIIYFYVDAARLSEDSDDGKRLLNFGFHLEDSSWAFYT